MTPNVSLLVITHNKLSYLRATLLTLQLLDFDPAEFEVVVVDDGSTDGTEAFLDQFEPGYALRWVSQPNGGRAAARNAAARLARGQLYVIVDDDCLMQPQALSHLWRAYQDEPGRMLIANVQHIGVRHVPAMLEAVVREGSVPWGDLQDYMPVDAEYALADLMRNIKSAGLDQCAVPWIVAQGASISIGAQQFHRLEGFDARFVAYGMEDFDFGYRFSDQGGVFRYVPQAVLYHLDHGHDRTALFKESTVTTRAFYAKFAGRPEIRDFTRFLCGAITFKEFNNRVAELKGMAPIGDMNVRFSPFGMIRYRDSQLGGAAAAPAAPLQYSKAQNFRLRFLIERISGDIDADASPLLPLHIEGGKSVLVIAPHMDDEVIGCGGLLSRYSRAGAVVTVLYLTDGAMRNLPPEEYLGLCRDRRAESEQAADILGVERCIYLSIPERNLAAAANDPGPIRRVLNECQPDIIVVPSELEHHPDHRAACEWLRLALGDLRWRPQIICYEVWGSCRPNRLLVLDAPSWRSKVEALGKYQTQLKVLDYQRLMDYLNEKRGLRDPAGTPGSRAEAYRQMDALEFCNP
jgi:LmbE family N-acetylglucosaminyl deacetylase/GT2 family glycosyltransferase